MRRVENFKLMILIAAVEDIVATVFPTQPVVHHILRFGVYACVVPLLVLHDYGLYLCRRIDYVHVAVVQLHDHLLMPVVYVYVGIRRNVKLHAHLSVYHHEAGSGYGARVVVVVIYCYAVVAAHLQPALSVGNAERIVSVEHGSVYRLFYVFYKVARSKAVYEITLKQLV